MVEITNKETGNYDVMMISTGDSFTRVVNRGCPKDPTQLALNSQGMLSNTKDRNESKTFYLIGEDSRLYRWRVRNKPVRYDLG